MMAVGVTGIIFLCLIVVVNCQTQVNVSIDALPGERVNITLACLGNGIVTFTNLPFRGFIRYNNTRNTFEIANSSSSLVQKEGCKKKIDPRIGKLIYNCANGEQHETMIQLVHTKKTDPFFCNKACDKISAINIAVNETEQINAPLANFGICDSDIVTGSYTLQEPNDPTFSEFFWQKLNISTYKLYLKSMLDFEKQQEYKFTYSLAAYTNVTLSVHIHVNDVDDMGISFTNNSYVCNITEEETGYAPGCYVHAFDLDRAVNATIQYEIVSVEPVSWTTYFNVSETGKIVLLKQLDRETQSSFTLFIKAYQTDKPTEKVNFTTVHINVVDIDDHLPEMSKDIYNVSIMENSEPGTIVAVLSATDLDLGANGAFRFGYDFKSLNNTSYLNCNASTGLITIGSKLLDREEIEKIEVEVYAYHLNNQTRKSNLSRVVIWIEDENDNSPNISGKLNYNIQKTLGVGQHITKLDVSDPDAGSNGKVNVTLESTYVPFEILSNEIDIRVARSMNETFDKVYHLLVKAEDQAEIQSERRISFVEVTINVKDVNIHEPDINVTSVVDLTEELPINSVVTVFEASDKDPDDHITCTVGGTSSDKFKIEDYTVVTTAVLDREVDTEYNISVNCNDTKHVTSERISVKLLDVNDNVPQFENATYFFEIEESKNETIGTVHATDDDFGNNSELNYFLEPESQWHQNVSVNRLNGQISTRHPLDREVLASGTNVSFLVFANDNGSPSLENQTLVVVKVLDINDNTPMFNSPTKTINITEKTPLNLLTSIYNAKAVDPDNGENGTVIYSLSGRDSSSFLINNTTGSIGMKKELTITNCTNPYLNVIVNASDMGSPPKSAQQDVTINIEDINDHAPVFVTGLRLEPVAEPGIKGVPLNYTVNGTRMGNGAAIATDDDCDDAFRTLHFWMENSDGRFHMDNTTGVISLRSGAILDHDPPQNDSNIAFQVFVSDGIHVVSKTIQLKVTNIISDVKPRFTQDRYNCFVNETLDWKEEDCCVEILYPESNSTLLDLFKVFTRDQRFNFTVKHGIACLGVSALDYEELGLSPVIINITANIPGVKNAHSRSSIAIYILNVNDETPMFESAYYNFSIYETQEVGTLIGVLGANDPDGDEKLTTAIVNGNKDFDMDGWKLLSNRTFDFENFSERMFIVNVSVSDGRHVNYTSVEVNVKPVNEYPPVVNISSTTFVKENEQLVIPFKVTDEDDGKDGNVECYLFAPKWISIELRGCSNITLPGVDFEQLGNHTVLELMLEARDQGNPSLDTVVNFTVTVEAVNDNVPYFREKYINVSVPEGPIHQCLYVAHAYDKDVSVGSEIQFSIRKEDPNITVSKNGSVCLNGDFWITADNNGQISFEIIVNNTIPYKPKDNSLLTSDNQTVTVNLLDINNQKPAFDHPVYNISVNECKKGGLNLTRVHATDADETPAFNTVHYSLVPSNVSGHFLIDSSSGDIVLVKPVDFDTLPSNNNPLVIEVHADDGAANHSDTATVRVTVLGCNDNRPSFTKEWYNCSVHERNRNLTCNVKAIDADRDQQVNLTYSIVGNKQGFDIDNHNGKISINSTQLDFETRQRYDLNVSVHDGNFTSYATVFVVVINDNDAKPTFTGLPYQLEVMENRYVKVLQVQVADIDSSENTLKYFINETESDSCKANDFFFLNNTAVLYVNNLNAENYSSSDGKCRLLIYVTDGQDNDTADVNVTILDENEFPPEIVSNGTLTLNDTTTVPTTVLEVDVTDADLTHSNFSYFLHNSDGHFEIDKNTGNVTLVKSIRNEAQAYNFTVVVLDSGSPPLDSMKTFNVAVVDVNEPPVLSELPMPIYVQQHTIANTTVFVVSATDPDIDDANKHMIFTLKGANGYFAITENGSVYVNRTLDTKVNISLEIRVTDAGGLFHANNYTVVVPYMNSKNVNKTWPENEIGNIDLINLGPSSFKLQQSAYSGFFVMHDNGSVSITTSFDREELESVSITVFGYDEHKVIVLNLTVYIEITDMNDCPPKLSDTYQFSVDDDTPLGTMFAEIVASDGDSLPGNRNVSYTSTDIEGFYLFSNGSLAVGNITYGKGVYIFNVTASDGFNEETAIVEIAIVDTNDHSPVFGNNSYTYKFMENINGTVAHVDATDIDSAQNGNISYHIFAGDSKGHFEMKGNVLSVQTMLDREDTAVYNLAIAAVDHAAHNPRTGMCTVTVIVEDDNDNAPTFNSAQHVGYIEENAAIYSMVQMNQAINATDIDNGSNGTAGIIYRLNGTDTFKIDSATGIITVKRPLDREETPEYNITITAVDSYGNTSYSRSSSIDIIIYVQDVNDNRPNFTKSLYTFNVIENSTVFTLAGNVSAVDVDEASQNNVRYYIVDGDEESFYIDRYNGSLFVVGKLNKNEYELNISSSDGKYFDFATVFINIVDVNNNAPQFLNVTEISASVSLHVQENNEPNIILYTINANDQDYDANNSAIDFSLPSRANADDMFYLNVSTGDMLNRSVAVLMLSAPLDREEKDRYILIVTASDRGEPKLSSNLTVTIIVDDQNDNAPVFFNGDSFNISSVETHIVEKSPVDSVIALIRANDSDVGENARLSYSIEVTSGSNYFEIDEALGLVTIKKQIVINTLVDEGIVQTNDTSSILLNLTVRATDHGSPNCSTTLKLVVHIEPINDNSPVFGTCSDKMSVMENKNATFIGRCEAYVENSTISHMHYTLINSFGTFEINEMGNISTTIPLDRETNQMYVLTVRATDGRIPERTAFTTVEVHVEDENDNSPVFYDPGEINIIVPENCYVNEWFNVSAYDRDTGANGDVTYVLSSESDAVFSLNKTGGLTIHGTFDYENVSSYTANITVYDSVHEITKRVTVCIKDLNDNAPAFQDKIGEMVEVSENATLGQEIFQVHANDTDSGWNGVVFYKILNIDPVSPFFIDAISGGVRLDGQLNFEQRSLYSLEIQAYDGGDPSLNSNRTITVNITDVYDDIPQFDHFLYETSIQWSADPVNMSVINLNCTGEVVTYHLTGGDVDKFRIDPLSGEIVVAGTLDKTNDRYFLTVTARDRVNKTATCQVLIKVTGHDVMFSSSTLTTEVFENITSRTLVADLNTTAELRGEHVVYIIDSIEPIEGKSLFEIRNTTGEVFCNPGVDRETTGQFVLYIRAESLREKRSLTGSTPTFKLVVNITDVNDNAPMFNRTAVRNFTVPLNSSPGKVVTVLKAYDKDFESSQPFIYRLTSGDNVTFSVNASTGAVVVEQPLTNLERNLFLLTVEAVNGPLRSDIVKINISINVVAVEDTVNITIGMTVGDILERQAELIRRMSDILAVNISIDRVEKHSSALNSEGNHMSFKGVFPDSSDMLIHAHIDGQLVPRNELLLLLCSHATELESLFGTRVRRYDPSAITESQLAIICFAVAIFFGAVIAIVFLEHSWSRSQHEYEEHVKRQQQKISEEQEMSTLRSRKSSTLSAQNLADSAANQACAETSFSQGVSDMGSGKKEDVQYETQEIRMEFGDEPINGNLPGPPQAASGTSIVDSGVANTSMQSEDPDQRSSEDLPENSGNPSSNGDEKNKTDPDHLRIGSGIGPVMTSSPRISMDGIRFKEPDFTIEAPEHGDDDGNDASYTYVKKKATVRFSGLGGETETDDELSEANDTDDGIEASAEKKETIVSDISDGTVLQETKTDTDTDEDEEDVTVTQF